MPDLPPDDPRFLKAYVKASGHNVEPRPRTGTIAAAVLAYEKSDHFISLAQTTREQRRRVMRDIRRKVKGATLADLRSRHIRQDLAAFTANTANNRLKVWRAMGRWWLDAGLIEDDPAVAVRRRATPKTDGYEAWTADDVAMFRAHWPHDTQQRLAFELMFRTCASIGDACRLGPQMVKDGWLTYTRSKSGSVAVIPMLDAPDWFGMDDHLERCLDAAPRHMTYIVTSWGAPRSHKGASQWFSRASTAAGIAPNKAAHGIRKYRAAQFLEGGANAEQRMAVLGHDTRTEAARYSKSADLKKVISRTEVPTPPEQVPTFTKKGS